MDQCQVKILEVKVRATAKKGTEEKPATSWHCARRRLYFLDAAQWPANAIGHWANPLRLSAKWHNHNKCLAPVEEGARWPPRGKQIITECLRKRETIKHYQVVRHTTVPHSPTALADAGFGRWVDE